MNNSFYNIDIPECRETINFSDVRSLPAFGSELGLFHVGHKALLVMEHSTLEKMILYALDELRAPIVETVKDEHGVLTFTFQLVPVVIDE